MPMLVAAAVAIAVHALALRIATEMMVEVRVNYVLALRIVAIEYAAMLGIAGAITGLQPGNLTAAILGCSLAYLFVGAACVGFWFSFKEGSRVGLGNGVLIQAIQIPLIIPVLIVGSFVL
ncbi:MAG: hypothetical protein HYY48_00460 [Gammaproteobacteria bacterium]|nr:hypothetical protein [Gammaproteobacteria bacterium]